MILLPKGRRLHEKDDEEVKHAGQAKEELRAVEGRDFSEHKKPNQADLNNGLCAEPAYRNSGNENLFHFF